MSTEIYSVNSTQTVNIPFPTLIINDIPSYIGDGNVTMDKDLCSQYEDNENIITIERFFTGVNTLDNLIKQYIAEKHQKIKVCFSEEKRYNENCNTAVVDSSREDSK